MAIIFQVTESHRFTGSQAICLLSERYPPKLTGDKRKLKYDCKKIARIV